MNQATLSVDNKPATKINLWAVLVCLVITQAVPMSYYTVFADKWIAWTGVTQEEAAAAPPTAYIFSMVGALIQILALAWLFVRLRVGTVVEGLGIGAMVGFCFCMITLLVTGTFEMKPLGLLILDGGQWVLTLTLVGAILGGWRKTA